MAGSVNKVILIGRLGKDPELEHTSGGNPMARFTLATDEVFKDRSGEQQRRTEGHTIIAWSKLAEICGEYLTKGRQVCVEGSIRSRQWEDQSGNKRTAYEIVARQMTMLGSRADSERASAASAERDQAHRPSSAEPGPEPEIADSVNKVFLIGRLGKDPELKYTPSGAPVAKFSLATDEVFKDRSGEQQKHTEWHNIVAWNKLAEICGEYLTKGKQVYIEGSIRSRQWEDQSGNKRTAYEIVARQMTMLGSKADSERAASERPASDRPASDRPAEPEPPTEPEITDSDIPF
jgi:single-strand DNA-binding protein